AAFAAGLQAIEVTINTERAEEIIAANRSLVPEGKWLGMGTIRTLAEAERAVAAGAMFLVTPNLDLAVIEFAKLHRIPVVVGALTPTEVYAAWRAGAEMIKVFPCGAMGGPAYIRDLRGPFEQVPLVAVGGVSIANLADYLAAGVKGVGVSTALFGREALALRDVGKLAENVRAFIGRCLAGQDHL
ncbi:MAG: hypothetical protein OEV73_10060, partial [Desulfobulbaceae bacterium]|nr:hypothetical protein [Desulfobulbaceae bacterium]